MAGSITLKEAKALGILPAGTGAKYKVRPKEERTYKGVCYDSGAEKDYAVGLDLDPNVEWWLDHVPVQLGEDVRWRADFLVKHRTDGCYFAEVKGHETRDWKRIKKLIAKYSPLPVLVIGAKGLREVMGPGTHRPRAGT